MIVMKSYLEACLREIEKDTHNKGTGDEHLTDHQVIQMLY